MNRILIHPAELSPEGHAVLSDERATHIRKVLRAEPGETLRVGLLNGPCGCGTVQAVSKDAVVLASEWDAAAPPRPPIDLLLAMPRPKVLKRLWAQFAALGVGRIFITNAEKVERFYFDTHILDPDFYNASLIEGLQQAGDTLLPEVTVVRNLKSFLENDIDALFPESEKRLLADPRGEKNIFQCLQTVSQRSGLAIGPEGGWMPYELEMFQAHGFELFGMGPRILRTDTACIGLISLLAESLRKGV